MKSYNVHEAKTNFSNLLSLVNLGEEIVISKAGAPIAMLVPYRKSQTGKGRAPGLFKGEIKIHDDFFKPMDDRFLKHFS